MLVEMGISRPWGHFCLFSRMKNLFIEPLPGLLERADTI